MPQDQEGRASLRDSASDTNLDESTGGAIEIESISDERAARLPSAYRAAVKSAFEPSAPDQTPTGASN